MDEDESIFLLGCPYLHLLWLYGLIEDGDNDFDREFFFFPAGLAKLCIYYNLQFNYISFHCEYIILFILNTILCSFVSSYISYMLKVEYVKSTMY